MRTDKKNGRSTATDKNNGHNGHNGHAVMADLKNWNYAIGFLLIFAGLVVSAHKTTPLGRGRGVVVGMLGCLIPAWRAYRTDIAGTPARGSESRIDNDRKEEL